MKMFINVLVHLFCILKNYSACGYDRHEEKLSARRDSVIYNDDIVNEITYLVKNLINIENLIDFENKDPTYHFENIFFDDDKLELFLRLADFVSFFIVAALFASVAIIDHSWFIICRSFFPEYYVMRPFTLLYGFPGKDDSHVRTFVVMYVSFMTSFSKFCFYPSVIFLFYNLFNNTSISNHQLINFVHSPCKNNFSKNIY